MNGLKGKRVLITGGASGIGKATVKRFLDEEAQVVVFDRDNAGLEKLLKEYPALTGSLPVDVSDYESVGRAFGQLDHKLNGLDILINNAGVSIRRPFLDITKDEWEAVIKVNLDGVFYVAQQAAKRMAAAQSGVIINMGSTNGIMGYPNYAGYNATKAAVIELTKSMALELAPHVRVVAVCPGYVLTPMQEAEYTPEMLDAVNQKIPLGRHARPEEIAALFAFLSSDEAAYINGHAFIIDGAEIVGGLASR
jgi:meso-butanediol dehydrogenase / (S,S)-butanediol dehydrogenase / diacetyl reductase